MFEGGNTTIFVSDMDRAVRFYTETLGMTLQFRAGNEWAQIDGGKGLSIGLHPPGQHTPKPGTPGSIQVGLMIKQPIAQAVETLTKRGVRFRGPIVDDDPVRIAFFGDPDGNDLYLCEYKQG